MAYRARQNLSYPDPASLRIVQQAGGLSRLSAADRARVRLREVAAGERCDDVPASSVPWMLEQGWIERVSGPAAPATPPAAEDA
jgi:hypothetical protein